MDLFIITYDYVIHIDKYYPWELLLIFSQTQETFVKFNRKF